METLSTPAVFEKRLYESFHKQGGLLMDPIYNTSYNPKKGGSELLEPPMLFWGRVFLEKTPCHVESPISRRPVSP